MTTISSLFIVVGVDVAINNKTGSVLQWWWNNWFRLHSCRITKYM